MRAGLSIGEFSLITHLSVKTLRRYAFAIRHHVRPTTHVYLMSRAQQALQDLKAGLFDGAAVLVNDRDTAQLPNHGHPA